MALPEGQARCALHPQLPAVGVCARCGSFMCERCTELQGTCPACREPLGVTGAAWPFHRDDYHFDALWKAAWAHFQREWLMLSLAVMIVFGVAGGASFLGQILQVFAVSTENWVLLGVSFVLLLVIQNLAQAIMQLGLIRVCFDTLAGKKVDLARLFTQFRKVGTYLVFLLLVMGMVLVPLALYGGITAGIIYSVTGFKDLELGLAIGGAAFLVALFPLIYFTLPLVLAQMHLADAEEPPDAWTLFTDCYQLADGHRWSLLGYTSIGGLCVLAGLLVCCIGILPGMAMAQMLLCALYLSLKNPSPRGQGTEIPTW